MTTQIVLGLVDFLNLQKLDRPRGHGVGSNSLTPPMAPNNALRLATFLSALALHVGPLPEEIATLAAGAFTRGCPQRLLGRLAAEPEGRALVALGAMPPTLSARPAKLSTTERARRAAEARWSKQAAGTLPGLPAALFPVLEPPQTESATKRRKLTRAEVAAKAAKARWDRWRGKAYGSLPGVQVDPPAVLMLDATSDALKHASMHPKHELTGAVSSTYASLDATQACTQAWNAQTSVIPGTYASSDACRGACFDASGSIRGIEASPCIGEPSPPQPNSAHLTGTAFALRSDQDQRSDHRSKRISSSSSQDQQVVGAQAGEQRGGASSSRETPKTQTTTTPKRSAQPESAPRVPFELSSMRLDDNERGILYQQGYTEVRVAELESRFAAVYGVGFDTRAKWLRRLGGFARRCGPRDRSLVASSAPVTAPPGGVTFGEPMVTCPADLQLLPAQRSTFVGKAGYTVDRLAQLTARFLVQYGSTTETRTLTTWQSSLAGFVHRMGPVDEVRTFDAVRPGGPAQYDVPVDRTTPLTPPLAKPAARPAAPVSAWGVKPDIQDADLVERWERAKAEQPQASFAAVWALLGQLQQEQVARHRKAERPAAPVVRPAVRIEEIISRLKSA